ncbi:hypothetical protein E2562_013749 [Oryza meyeriana var. granulata]|uniref:Pentatricopeptide repeat-containing protein n=1 Tax=Oryza meyeriana var. granulata TaxID=110450 RepID=A0A6G1BK78_9ORYZ|nr:hypothetical protein E2562_013749 [Oryza meyeriana var. granulata]
MVSSYCKKGYLEMTRVIFDKMPSKNLVTWTIMVCACAQKGLVDEAGKLFAQMKEASVELDVAAVVVPPACGKVLPASGCCCSACRQGRARLLEQLAGGNAHEAAGGAGRLWRWGLENWDMSIDWV